MKTINELEQEAQQARDDMRDVMREEFGIGATLSDRILSLMIRAVKSNIAQNDTKQEVSGDGSGEYLPEVSQEERDSDGFIKWGGGNCPVDSDAATIVKFRDGNQACEPHKAGSYEWRKDIVERSWDIVAYKIVKG